MSNTSPQTLALPADARSLNPANQPRHLALLSAAQDSKAELETTSKSLVAAQKNFSVVDLRSANWVIRKIHDARLF